MRRDRDFRFPLGWAMQRLVGKVAVLFDRVKEILRLPIRFGENIPITGPLLLRGVRASEDVSGLVRHLAWHARNPHPVLGVTGYLDLVTVSPLRRRHCSRPHQGTHIGHVIDREGVVGALVLACPVALAVSPEVELLAPYAGLVVGDVRLGTGVLSALVRPACGVIL